MTGPEPALDVPRSAAQEWAASGLMALSGPVPGGRCGPPERLVDGVAEIGRRITAASTAVGSPVVLDWLALLGERAAIDGLSAGGRASCGGAARLLRCADGWLAVSLARPTDLDLVPAWLALADAGPVDPSALGGDPWDLVAAAVGGVRSSALVGAADLVGLPVGRLGERWRDPSAGVTVTRVRSSRGRERPKVVDLSALWAGPLCASILAMAGAEVVKVESAARPDAARDGSPAFFELLNGAKEHLVLDLDEPAGRAELTSLIKGADVVVESARPRALEHLGIVAEERLGRSRGPQVWVSITGHGRASSRVAFGDDAAVAGGLVVATEDGPWFCGDAIADPLSGLAAAASALEVLTSGERALVDVAMAGVAVAHAGPTLAPAPGALVAPPRARVPVSG